MQLTRQYISLTSIIMAVTEHILACIFIFLSYLTGKSSIKALICTEMAE